MKMEAGGLSWVGFWSWGKRSKCEDVLRWGLRRVFEVANLDKIVILFLLVASFLFFCKGRGVESLYASRHYPLFASLQEWVILNQKKKENKKPIALQTLFHAHALLLAGKSL
jgi:hypothetical protein